MTLADGSARAPFDAVVLGAGNVGLLAALLLLRQGLAVRVCAHRRPAPVLPATGFDARVYALNTANIRQLRELGVWQRLDASRLGAIDAMEVHGDEDGRLHFAGEGSALAVVVEDGALQGALLATLDAENRASAWWHAGTAEAVSILPDHAMLELSDQPPCHARLLVGADGSQSWLRQTLGWRAVTHDYGQHGVVLNLACARPHDGVARQWFSEGEVIALLPLGGQHVSLVWSARDRHADALMGGGAEACLAELAQRIGLPLGPLTPVGALASWPLRLTRVPVICDQRVVLLGDAAHAIHPLAGQGLNLGLEDAFSLANTLAGRLPVEDCGQRSLLRRHARRRAEPVARMQLVTDTLQRLFADPAPALAHLRNQGMRWVDRAPLLKSLLAASAAGESGAL